jgi:small subunit ribosomal protein S6
MAKTHPSVTAGYETTFITKSELSDESLKTLQDRLNQVVASFSGEVVLTEDWGKKKMAYPISKENRGHYTYFVYTGKPGVVHELERNLRLNDHVLRFLTVNLDEEFDAPQFKKQRADIHAAAKRREEEREARREEKNSERRYDDRRDSEDSEDLDIAESTEE